MFAKKRTAFILFVCVLLLTGVSAAGAQLSQRSAATAVPAPGAEIVISALDNEEFLPAAAYNWKHHEYLVVWHTKWVMGTRDIRAARVSSAGQVLATFTVYNHPTQDSVQPSVAYDPVNDRYLAVWVSDAAGGGSDWDVYGRFIPWNGPSVALTEFPICTWSTSQWTPQVAYGRAVEEFLVVWNNQYQNGALPMYLSGRRITAANGAFPGGDSDLTINHPTNNRLNPALTYNLARNEYLLVYDDTADILATRYTGRLDHNFGGEFAIAGWPAAETQPAVAACRGVDQYLVAWQSDQSAGNDAIYARFLSGAAVPGNVHLIDDTTSPEQAAAVACNQAGGQYLIAWQSRYTNLKFGIWARLIDPDETIGSGFALAHPYQNADRATPFVAGGGANYLVVWEQERGGTAYQDIYGRLVAPYTAAVPVILSDK